MKNPKKSEVAWKKAKLLKNGENGIEIEYSYIMDIKGRGILRSTKETIDLTPHDDLINLFNRLKPIVSKVENYDYARNLLSIAGFEPTDEQISLTEQTLQHNLKLIEVTGISLSEKKKDEGAIISYSKTDKNDQVTGHVTAWINLKLSEYSIEEELEEIVEEIKSELFQYLYEDKYADFEQLSIDYDSEESETDDMEYAINKE